MAHNLHIERELDYGLEHKGSQWFYNNSSADLDVGDVVILDVTDLAGKSVTTTTSAGDTKVVGVCQTRAVDGKRVKVNFEGVSTVKVNGTTDIVAGTTYLKSYTEAGIASAASSNAEAGVFGLALSGYTANNSLGEVSIKLAKANTQGGISAAEAIAAVENEATLVLAGDVSISGSKSLSVDVINEKDADAGVTIDSVVLKDGLVDGVDVAARDHAKYTDAEAISAVEGADLAFSDLASLTSGNILVGNGSGVAASVNPSGDVDITNAGVFSIASGVIVNDDVKSDAAIADSKLATISTADKVSGAAIQVDGATDGTAITIADADKFLIDDAGATKYVTASQINTYVGDSDTTYSVAANGGVGLSGTTLSLDIDGMTDIGAAIVSGDLLALDDGANGTNRKTTVDRVATLFAGTSLTATNGVISVDDKFIKNDADDTSSHVITAAGFTTDGSVTIDSTPTDETVSGITATFTAGEALSRGEVVYYKQADSRMWKAVATAAATSRCVAMAAADIGSGSAGLFLLQGFCTDNGTFPDYSASSGVGKPVYTPEAETVGENVPEAAAPDTDGDFVQIIGYVVAANTLYFNPSMDIIEHA